MGLDIYVHWGDQDPESGEWKGFPDEAREDQITGYTNAPESGYLRHNWSSVRFCREFPEKVDAPSPLSFFKEWSGYNGEELIVSEEILARLVEHRMKIKAWLREGLREAREHGRKLPESEREEFFDNLEYFEQVLRNTAGFINFVELHKDKPNLTVVFG